MDIKEKAKIVAFAKLLGVQGTEKEIFDRFHDYCKQAETSLNEPKKPANVEFGKRSF